MKKLNKEYNMNKENRKIIFLHLPKVGGSSMHSLLVKNFKKSDIYPERLDKISEYPVEKLNSYKLFSGHYAWNSLESIVGEKHIIVLFREPKNRILSLYYFWKSHTYKYLKEQNLKGFMIAKEMDLLNFLRYDGEYSHLVLGNIDNAISFQMAGYNYNKILQNHNRQDALQLIQKKALLNLNSVDSVGILEKMDESIKLIMDDLDFEWDGVVPRENVFKNLQNSPLCESVEKEIITEEIESELKRLTIVDQIIYDEAVKKITQRLKKYDK